MNARMIRKILMGVMILLAVCGLAFAEEAGTELAVLTTTDMHGRCWETNVLTEGKADRNMLRVSTAVKEIRQEYGEENVILIDSGDTFQGTPVSEVHLLRAGSGEEEPEAMALCLAEIGYDAMVLGNHEFNFPWSVMSGVYDYLRGCNVAVLAANAYYDGSDGVHGAGENAFGTYIIREIQVNGHPHKIGILGLENTDITRWDLPVNYPGMVFTHADNPAFDESAEANRYIAMMREEGCEMIILAYHGGLGNLNGELAFGINSENQGLRILKNTDSLDLLITGHDHSAAYSGSMDTDRAGRTVPIVNGGGQNLTKTVFRLTEDAEGNLACELLGTDNLRLGDYEPDAELEEKIRPYAEMANEMMDQPVGSLTGEWDGSREFYTLQNDTMDLICAAMMAAGTKRMEEIYGADGLAALQAETGLDHLEADAACTTPVNGGYIAAAGPITTRNIYRMSRYSNSMVLLPMTGGQLKAVMEENASERLTARTLKGQTYFFPKNDSFTHIVFGGINFRYDMSRPAGERVLIDGFADGRAFDPDAVYLVAVNNYILGNERCGFRIFSDADTVWSQAEDGEGIIQDVIQEYITDLCGEGGTVSKDLINWRWSITYTGEPEVWDGPAAAVRVDAPAEGRRYIILQETQECTLTTEPDSDGFRTAGVPTRGECLTELPEAALILTAHISGEDTVALTDPAGRYLACGPNGGLTLTEADAESDLLLWKMVPAEGGYYLLSAGAENRQALEYYGGRINTYWLGYSGQFLFNFYEVGDSGNQDE